MNNAKSNYTISGWDVIASEFYNDWELVPTNLNVEEYEEFYNNHDIRFKKLSDCKRFIKTAEAENIRSKYIK